MSNRFDLEQSILKAWNVVDDLELLYERVMEGEEINRDELANILLGMVGVSNMRFEKCFSIFEALVRSRQLDRGCSDRIM